MKNKLIVLDYGIFLHRAIFSWRNNKQIPPEYIALNMIISCLRHIGVEPMDEIIVACDGRGNWRKQLEEEYKANRKQFRESFEDINWKDMYSRFDILLDNLDKGTDWHIIKLDMIEADDIASVSCRYFKDKEIILVSYDCLGGDSRIKLIDGSEKFLYEIQKGDKVLSYDIKNKKFTESIVNKVIKKKHKEELLIYYGNEKKPIRSSINHYFYTTKGWKKAKDLNKNDEILYHKNIRLPKLKWEDSYKIGYILGLADGDGHIIKSKKKIQYEMKDKESLKRILTYCNQLFNYHPKIYKYKRKNKKENYYILHLYLNLGFDYLYKIERNNSLMFQKGYLAGFYDAEGSITENNRGLQISFYNNKINLLNKCKKYLKNLKLHSSKIFKSTNKCLKFTLNGQEAIRFLDSTKPALLRKYPKWNKHISFLQNGLKIYKIEKKIAKRNFLHYDLNVEPYHNYIVNNTVLVHNSDWEQLWYYDNVKIFSPLLKPKRYKIPPKNFNVYQFIAKKIDKEVTDNLVNPILNQKDYEKREQVVSLLKLPDFVENAIIAKFQSLEEKTGDIENVPFEKIREKITNLYNDKSKVVNYEDCKNRKKRKKKRRKKKHANR